MNGKQFLEMLARLPARVWLQAILGLIGFVVLAVLASPVIAGWPLSCWSRSLSSRAAVAHHLFTAARRPSRRRARDRSDRRAYEIVDRRKDTGRARILPDRGPPARS